MMLQQFWLYAPILISAFCIPMIYWRAGYPRKAIFLSTLPATTSVFSFCAALVGEREIVSGLQGLWPVAAALLVLAFSHWPYSERQN